MPAPVDHLTLLTALRRRWSRLTDYERGKVVACEVDAAIGPLDVARVAWMQSIVSHRIVPVRFAKHLYARCCAVAQTAYEENTYRSMMQDASKHLSVLDLEPERSLYGEKLVLARPDQHVAWRGNLEPPEPLALIDRIRGAAA